VLEVKTGGMANRGGPKTQGQNIWRIDESARRNLEEKGITLARYFLCDQGNFGGKGLMNKNGSEKELSKSNTDRVQEKSDMRIRKGSPAAQAGRFVDSYIANSSREG